MRIQLILKSDRGAMGEVGGVCWDEVICENTDMAGQEGALKINFSFSLAVFSNMTRKHFLRYPSSCNSKISSAF
jgi:hypothetical protein